MLTEPREAQPRKSTFTLVGGEPSGMLLKTVYEGDPAPLYTRAIYRFAGDTLLYCVGAPGHPRPVSFVTARGDRNTQVVLTRQRVLYASE